MRTRAHYEKLFAAYPDVVTLPEFQAMLGGIGDSTARRIMRANKVKHFYIHHDGTNHYLYRTYKDGVSDTQIDNLKEKLYRGTATRADITRITRRLGDEIARVYGFPIPRRQAPVQER